MKVVIFAGGFGTRLGDITKKIPKPMVKIKGKPIIYYIIKTLSYFGSVVKYLILKKRLTANI